MYCIDASVFVSAQLPLEPYVKESRGFLQEIEKGQTKVFLPEIVIPETSSGLFRATKDAPFVSRYLRVSRSVPNFSFVPVDSHLADLASWIVLRTGLRGADAVYVALASRYELELVTLDKEQLRKGKLIVAIRTP